METDHLGVGVGAVGMAVVDNTALALDNMARLGAAD
jgi:hypothetical protein